MKISIVGVGMVGASFGYRLVSSGLADEIALIDVNTARAEGEAMDMSHAMAFEYPCKIYDTDFAGAKSSDIIVICAGLAQKPGETRLDLVAKNAAIFKEMIPQLTTAAPDALYLIASNPVDVMTYATIKYGNLDPRRVMGSGTTLDTMRLRYFLAQHFKVSPQDVSAFIIGEHGDSQLPAYQSATIRGISLQEFAQIQDVVWNEEIQTSLAAQVKNAAYEIINRKMATYYGIGSGLLRLVQALVRDEKGIFPVSTLGDHGTAGSLCVGQPTII